MKTRSSPGLSKAWVIAVNESMTRRTIPNSSMFRTISSQIAGKPSAVRVGISRNRNIFLLWRGGMSKPRRRMFRRYVFSPSSIDTYMPGSPWSLAP